MDDGFTTVVGSLSLERARAARWKRAAKQIRQQRRMWWRTLNEQSSEVLYWQKRHEAICNAVASFSRAIGVNVNQQAANQLAEALDRYQTLEGALEETRRQVAALVLELAEAQGR